MMMRSIHVPAALLLCCWNIAFGAADLEIRTLTGVPGPEFRIEFVVVNHGPDAANHAGCNIYFYSNEKLVLSQAMNLQPLEPGASRNEEFVLQVPARFVTTVKLEVFDSRQPDTQPSTNFMQMNIKPADLRKADLQVIEVKQDERKGKGAFLVRLRNHGPARIAPSKLQVELEVFGEVIAREAKRVDRLESAEELETRVGIPSAPIIPSTNGVLSVRWEIPEVDDPEPSNNVYRLPVPLVLRMPDLLPLNAKIDRQGTLTFAIQNKGNARAPSTVTALYINGALVERYNTPEIAPRGSSQYTYKAMKLTSDDKIVVVADFNADVQEASEENNRLN